MNIECEIAIRGDTCQCSALSLRCRRTQLPYRPSAGAPPLSGALQTATFPLYQPGEACLPFSGLIFLLELLLFTRFLYAMCSLSSFSSFFFSFSLTPSCSPPSTSLHTTGRLVWFSSLWRDPSAAFHIPSCLSVCLSVFLMAECMALWLQERCFMSAFK